MIYNGGGGVAPSASGHAAIVEVIYKSSTQPCIQKTQARAPFGDEELNTKTLPVEILCRNDVMRMVDDGQDATVRAAECEGLDFVVPDATASTDFRRSCLVKPRRAVSGSKTNLKPQKTKHVFATVVPKDHSYPTSIRKSYYMPQDNQTELLMRVLASATATLSSSNLIGEFLLSGIPAAPVGDIEVEVSFAIDINGVLDVTAVAGGAANAGITIDVDNTDGRIGTDLSRIQTEMAPYLLPFAYTGAPDDDETCRTQSGVSDSQ